jgi:transcription antitermination factor NusB
VSSLASERRAARERALGLLYEAEVKGRTAADLMADLPSPPDGYAAALVGAVDDHDEEIDRLISSFSRGWALDRMPALDRAALRMGTAELIARPDVPTGVVLAETVDLASRFSTDGSGRFVNGLLARIAREVRSETGEAPELPSVPAGSSAEVGALVIDLDGVIRHWDNEGVARLEAEVGLPAGALTATAMEPDRLQRAMDGRLPFDDWCQEIGDALAAAHGVDAGAAAAAWAGTPWRIDLTVIDLVRAVRARGVPVAMLSNASSRLELDLERSDILGEFDAVVSSAAIGVTKPAPGAYRAAAEAVGVAPERCLFVDDIGANVEGAAAVGMRAERFDGVERLRALLEEVGLL